ncbi:DNA/RNA polymerase [Teratosphaeria nubilosa]|uniref:DNA/RNA polymerase n=1 Tax=Teratosphaeria nubilosa TaxID=161662 RepID=A0A6G1L2P7_9PEZI|nr:DNA/RNA polymerase [Teratosphaeria nubilosa]
METKVEPARKDGRIIIHFDYDCFYASVFEAKNPALKGLPFAVQQKQIIVTCNYEARRRGLHKLQLIKDARRICPDVIIELGEDISRFRDASKELYTFLKAFCWSNQVERLGFDEVWMDVTDMVEDNMEILNRHCLEQSFFQMSRDDPTIGFAFDASAIAGHAYPKDYQAPSAEPDILTLRLRLGSHLALYMRHQLEQQKGYTCTVGIATSKLLSKLVGNLNKPKGQTTLLPPLTASDRCLSNITTFIDAHDVGKIPGIGFRLAQKLRAFVLERSPDFDRGLVYGGTKENVTVGDVRKHPDITPQQLERILAGPGSPHGIGWKIWCLLHGVDDTAVSTAKAVPSQISIEDSYIRLDTMPELLKELEMLARSLITRMRVDLLGGDEEDVAETEGEVDSEAGPGARDITGKKWLAHPKTLRLTTRPRQPLQPDGTRVRSFKRISHSGPLPNLVFSLSESIDSLAERLVRDSLVTMFKKLHPEKFGWNLSLVNLAVTNMAEAGGQSKSASGRDIGSMFNRQEDVLKDFRRSGPNGLILVTEASDSCNRDHEVTGASNDVLVNYGVVDASDKSYDDGGWDEEGTDDDEVCFDCGMHLPTFAMIAHRRFHNP